MSTILLISPEPWESHFVSKHHYARELARRGHYVIFCGPPENRRSMRLQPVLQTNERLQVLTAPRVFPGLRFLPSPVRRLLEFRWLRQVELMACRTVDVVWNFENSRFFDMRFAGCRLKIYHQVDLNQKFNPEIAAATADLSISISGPIEEKLRPVAQKLIRITHGQAEQDASCTLPKDLTQKFEVCSVNAVLVGNLSLPYLDVGLLANLVAQHPSVCFHFVGSYSTEHGLHIAVGSAGNTVFWGRQPSSLLPSFLNRADILLITYLADEYLDQLANPHKMMEYLASGRCILATRTLEYEHCQDLVEVAMSNEEFLQLFSRIVASPEAWNSPDLVAKRQAFAADNTYTRQLDRIVDALGPQGHLIS